MVSSTETRLGFAVGCLSLLWSVYTCSNEKIFTTASNLASSELLQYTLISRVWLLLASCISGNFKHFKTNSNNDIGNKIITIKPNLTQNHHTDLVSVINDLSWGGRVWMGYLWVGTCLGLPRPIPNLPHCHPWPKPTPKPVPINPSHNSFFF